MDACSPRQEDLPYSDSPPVLIAGSNEPAIERAKSSIIGSGFRVGAIVDVADAPARLKLQGHASAVWIELDQPCLDGDIDELVKILNADVRSGRYSAIVSAPRELVDTLASVLDDDVQLIIDADEAERASALALAFATAGEIISDVGSDRSAERLRQLSDEVSRIASTLARLSAGPGASSPVIRQVATGEAPSVSADTIRSIIRARRLRARFFSEELFADPAWDMLLDLLQAEISHLRVPVSSLCIAAAVPATTALRWLKTMVSQGLFVRRADPHDGRRVFVELAPEASRALRSYFAEVGPAPVI
jgi:DNA-binding MarR family transcriptional regulator